MQSTDDSALLRQYTENNSDEAFAALVTKYINLVYSVAMRRVGNPASAEEITQAVFIILARKAGQLRHDKALSSWLFQITRLTANNFIRSETRRHRREEEAYMQNILNETGTEVWLKIAPLLDDAVAGLREKDRQAVVLRFYEGKKLHEVGLALGASEDAAEKRVARALEKLRKFFTKRGVSSTTAIIAGTISANSVQAAPVALAKSVTAVAIAKGAAASGSTLTLIKGALKIMAWTKVKTVILVGGIAIVGAGIVTVATYATKTQAGTSKVVFAGYATPETAIQSTIWAASTGDLDKLSNGVTSQVMDGFKNSLTGKSDDEIKSALKAWAKGMADYKITEKDVISEDEVHLHIHATPSADALHSGKVVIIMKKIGGEWKQAGQVN